ncbi:MAG: RecX family transcriptional regulator [Dehalococcoidales bacterium]
MIKITNLVRSAGRGKTVRLFLDGRFAFNLLEEVVLKEKLAVGMELSEAQIASLQEANRCQKCLSAALQILNYRPRSERELRMRLQRRNFNENEIHPAIQNLKRMGFIDDESFARFWTENRQSFSPRSRKMTEMELRQKGVPLDVIEQEVSTMDDTSNAYRAGQKYAHNLKVDDYSSFRRRLGEYLKRRGFGYEVINNTVTCLWNEKEGGDTDDFADFES